jgi:hypothetical protein
MTRRLGSAVIGLVLALTLSACSSVGGSAVRTGPVQLPAYSGPVAIYSSGQPPPGAVDLGVVEVHASQDEGTVDTLLPQLVRKVAQIGGNVAVVDGVRARFELVGRMHVETFYYTCGLSMTCAGTRVYPANYELMVVSMFGRAFSTRTRAGGQGQPSAAGDSLLPPEPAPPPPSPGPGPSPSPSPTEDPDAGVGL